MRRMDPIAETFKEGKCQLRSESLQSLVPSGFIKGAGAFHRKGPWTGFQQIRTDAPGIAADVTAITCCNIRPSDGLNSQTTSIAGNQSVFIEEIGQNQLLHNEFVTLALTERHHLVGPVKGDVVTIEKFPERFDPALSK
jgi:hypothetical protein